MGAERHRKGEQDGTGFEYSQKGYTRCYRFGKDSRASNAKSETVLAQGYRALGHLLTFRGELTGLNVQYSLRLSARCGAVLALRWSKTVAIMMGLFAVITKSALAMV
jgi:hypothetical protein